MSVTKLLVRQRSKVQSFSGAGFSICLRPVTKSVMRHAVILAIVLLAAGEPRASRGAETSAIAFQTENEIRGLLRDAGVQGAACIVDVQSGRTIASVGSGQDAAAPILPLSVIKLFVASMWWDLSPAKRRLTDPQKGAVTMDDVLVMGYDAPGEEAAIALRKMLGTKRMLAGLGERGLGLPPGKLDLGEQTDDATWGQTLSIGEINVTVTLEQVARFLRGVGATSSPSARSMQSALRGCVTRGSASSVADRLTGTGWALGGKTGTGPASASPNYDGCFAGLIFKGDEPRYAFAIYIQGRGKGGGVAARMAADLASWFATQRNGSGTD